MVGEYSLFRSFLGVCTALYIYTAFNISTKNLKLYKAWTSHFPDIPFKVFPAPTPTPSFLFATTDITASESCNVKQLLLTVSPNVLRAGLCVRSNKDKPHECTFPRRFQTGQMEILCGWVFLVCIWGKVFSLFCPAYQLLKCFFHTYYDPKVAAFWGSMELGRR